MVLVGAKIIGSAHMGEANWKVTGVRVNVGLGVGFDVEVGELVGDLLHS